MAIFSEYGEKRRHLHTETRRYGRWIGRIFAVVFLALFLSGVGSVSMMSIAVAAYEWNGVIKLLFG